VIDVTAVPNRFEDCICKAKDQQILDGFLAEVVIDTEDLIFREVSLYDRVQLLCRLLVFAERLLDDEPVPAGRLDHPGFPHTFDDRFEEIWIGGEVPDAVPAGTALFVEFLESLLQRVEEEIVFYIPGQVVNVFGEFVP
jgi:hypothetical protein